MKAVHTTCTSIDFGNCLSCCFPLMEEDLCDLGRSGIYDRRRCVAWWLRLSTLYNLVSLFKCCVCLFCFDLDLAKCSFLEVCHFVIGNFAFERFRQILFSFYALRSLRHPRSKSCLLFLCLVSWHGILKLHYHPEGVTLRILCMKFGLCCSQTYLCFLSRSC